MLPPSGGPPPEPRLDWVAPPGCSGTLLRFTWSSHRVRPRRSRDATGQIIQSWCKPRCYLQLCASGTVLVQSVHLLRSNLPVSSRIAHLFNMASSATGDEEQVSGLFIALLVKVSASWLVVSECCLQTQGSELILPPRSRLVLFNSKTNKKTTTSANWTNIYKTNYAFFTVSGFMDSWKTTSACKYWVTFASSVTLCVLCCFKSHSMKCNGSSTFTTTYTHFHF